MTTNKNPSTFSFSNSLLSEQVVELQPLLPQMENDHDPMLSVFDDPQEEELPMGFDIPINFGDSDFLQHEPELSDFSLMTTGLLPLQLCGGILQ